MYIEKLDDIVNKYTNTYYSAIKKKPVGVRSGMYIHVGTENNDKYPKFKVCKLAGISKCKSIFAKGYTSNWSGEVFVT